jgi:hypothetical protein
MVRYNVVSAGLERVLRDLEYLEITCAEYLPIAQDYAATVRRRVPEQKKGPEGVRALTQEESDEFDAQRRHSMLLRSGARTQR